MGIFPRDAQPNAKMIPLIRVALVAEHTGAPILPVGITERKKCAISLVFKRP